MLKTISVLVIMLLPGTLFSHLSSLLLGWLIPSHLSSLLSDVTCQESFPSILNLGQVSLQSRSLLVPMRLSVDYNKTPLLQGSMCLEEWSMV